MVVVRVWVLVTRQAKTRHTHTHTQTRQHKTRQDKPHTHTHRQDKTRRVTHNTQKNLKKKATSKHEWTKSVSFLYGHHIFSPPCLPASLFLFNLPHNQIFCLPKTHFYFAFHWLFLYVCFALFLIVLSFFPLFTRH